MKLVRAAAGRTYTVAPLPEADPSFTVTVRSLSDGEVNAIYDRHKFMPGSKSASMAKAAAVIKDQIKASVVGWEGATDGDGKPLECTDDAKLTLYDVEVEINGEITTVWNLIQAKVADQKAAEAKN